MTDAPPGRTPVILLDTIGYDFYQDPAGRKFLPPDRYAVRLVTDIAKLAEARGNELQTVVAVPKMDERALADAVRFQAAAGGVAPARLVAITERILLLAAGLREELGIPGASIADVLPFRDKLVMKQRLREHGIRVPEFAPFSEIAAAALLRSHPRLVAKPRLGAGAIDIFVLGSWADITAFADSHVSRLEEFEVEEFIAGQLCHVDSVVQDARVVAAVASRYVDDTTSYQHLAPCRDVGIPAGPELDDLLEFNRRVLACFPGFTGVTHHEMFVTASGICFCEIAARAGGGGVIATFLSRTGINLDEAAVQAQLIGSVPAPSQVPGHLTGWTVLYSGAGLLTEPIVPPAEPWVLEAQILAAPGEQLSRPRNCNDAVAVISVRGDSETEVINRLTEVIERTVLKVSSR
jgi:biotin carboxylase